MTDENCESSQTISKPDSDISSQPECSRRAFLETFVGAATMARGVGYISSPGSMTALKAAAVTATDELANLELNQAATLIRQKKVSPVQLTETCLSRIEARNPLLNAFITVTPDSALAQAREAEAELQRGMWRGPLHGIPVALKDLIDTAGIVTTAGSALFKDRVPSADAAVVQRLRDSGAVILGKLNMYEVAFGPTTRATSFFWSCPQPLGYRTHFRWVF